MSEMLYKRFFIVCYNFLGDNKDGFGDTTMVTKSDKEEGVYLNRERTMEILEDKLSRTGYDGCKPIITNIIEVSESEYKDWIATKEEAKSEPKEEDSPMMIDVELDDVAIEEVKKKFNDGWDEEEITDHLVFEKMKPTPKTTDDEMAYLVRVAIKKIVTNS